MLSSASAVCKRTTRQNAFAAQDRGSGRTFHCPISSITWKRSQKQRSYPECPTGSDPLFLSVRGFRGARTCAPLPANPGGAQQAPRTAADRVSQLEKKSMRCSPSPNLSTWIGRRDRALLLVAVQTGLRVSELIRLNCQDVVLGTGAHVRCLGKGRKQRCTPLRPETAKMLDAWLRERHGRPEDPLFPSIRGGRLSRDAVERLITKYTHLAAQTCPSLKRKKVSPHVCATPLPWTFFSMVWTAP